MSLETAATFNTLPVCPRCGWAIVPINFERHVRDCPNVAAGATAIELAARFPELHSTKFGYGNSNLTFELDDDMYVRLECSNGENFELNEVWLLDRLSTDETADLVRALANWRRNCISRRERAARASRAEILNAHAKE